MPTLYRFVPQDRSGKVSWLLKELDISHDVHNLDYQKEEHNSEDYLKLNPMGHVPTWVDKDLVITDSNAIVTFLAEANSEKIYVPGPASGQDRADYLSWINFSESTFEFVLQIKQWLKDMSDDDVKDWSPWVDKKMIFIFSAIDNALKESDFLVGNQFSAADICVSCAIKKIIELPQVNDYPKVKDYFKRMTSRKAAQDSKVF